ncbi:dUTP diphosphatase [Tissierella pigra]|uniref:dUTP diphosphatase n=1 Tax=Tissierella pigra TaxID=2607614 RepID=UPI001C113BF3|nr:dUTP diphosphatase [Tissierella pigra]MBU5424988.1 dUTP diphosphatase [Tissierella pigra]
MEMKIKCTGEKPSYANKYAAGLDMRSNERVCIMPGGIVDIETLLAVEIPKGHFGMVVARSGLSFKNQIKLINDVGIIDEDYRGNIGIRLINEGKEPYLIEVGDRVAQMIIMPYIQPKLVYVDELEETERGNSGFGSTGK